jgi:hypothetical protein
MTIADDLRISGSTINSPAGLETLRDRDLEYLLFFPYPEQEALPHLPRLYRHVEYFSHDVPT